MRNQKEALSLYQLRTIKDTTMTRETLNKIAKANKIDLTQYMKVAGFINPNYTKVFILFFDEEGVGFDRIRCNQKTITMNVSAIQKRDEFPEDYCTDNAGGEWIYEIR